MPKEIDELSLRSFGDGKSVGRTPEEAAAICDPNIPWSEKRLWFAKSNGCYQPDHFLEEVAKKNPGVEDPEEIAKLASIEYGKQNFVFGLMREWAGLKEDKRLLVDMTETPYPRDVDLHFEHEHVPESFAQEGGVATGMARNEGFLIAERVARILGNDELFEEKRTQYLNMLSLLENQVQTASSMKELYTNFFDAIGESKSDS